jgi:hypothetical protein
MTIIRWMRRTTTVDIAFGSFATDPVGLASHLVSALAGKQPDCDRTRMADISAPPRFMRETQCCPNRLVCSDIVLVSTFAKRIK